MSDLLDEVDPVAFYTALVRACPDAIIVVDHDGHIVFASEAGIAMFGADELTGTHVDALVPDDVRIRHHNLREGYQAAPRPRPMGLGTDLRARRVDDGHEFAVDISLTPITINSRGYNVAWVRDVADRVHGIDVVRLSQALATLTKSQPIAPASPARSWWRSWYLPAALAAVAITMAMVSLLR